MEIINFYKKSPISSVTMSKKVIFLIFFLVSPFVLGETYHVRVDGSDSSEGLSYETAWKSIAYSLENSNENSEILIYEGEYLEDSQWGGYLYVNQEKENRTFIGMGNVVLKVGPDVNRMILFVGPELTIFEGFVFDGQNSAVLGMDSSYGNKVFRNNQFINFLDYGISLKGGENNVMENNTFGYDNLHMDFSPVILTNLKNSRIENNQFFSGKESLLYAFNSSNSSIKNNIFGSEENPLFLDTYATFIRVIDSDNFIIENNELYIGDGNGITVYSNIKDVENPRMVNNSFFIYHSLNRYGIAVGSESEQEFDLIGANISGNRLYMPAEETYKHNLFVGFTKNSIISGNYLDGGGYGLALKGNNDALVFGNEVYNATTVAIVDNAGWNNKIFDNVVNCNYDRCMRIDNTESAGRPLYNSSWYNNTMFVNLGELAIYVGSSVDVIESGSNFFDNNYYQGEHEQIIGSQNISYFTFFDLRDEFEWGGGSHLFASNEIPEIWDIQVYGIQPTSARVKFNTSEASTSTLRYGEGDLDMEIISTEYKMEHNYVLTDLHPKTWHNYQIIVCDNEENCIDSDILNFRTNKEKKLKLPNFSVYFGH